MLSSPRKFLPESHPAPLKAASEPHPMTISPTYPYPPLTPPEASLTAEARAEPKEATEWWRNTAVTAEGARLEDTLTPRHHAALMEFGWKANAAVRGCTAVTAEHEDLVDNWYAEAVAKDKKA